MADPEMKQEETSYEPPQHEVDSSQSSQSETPTEQPRTVGGFIVDDDEDDSGMPRPSVQVNGFHGGIGDSSSNTPQHSISFPHAAQPAHFNGDAPEQAIAQDQNHAAFVPNGIADDVPLASALPVGDSQGLGAVESSTDVPAVQVSSIASPLENVKSLPRARLPQDKIGMLEDRIKEDPRGDLDAWMSLINEHKRRNKVEDVRATYDRFLEVFPTSVSFVFVKGRLASTDNHDRLNSGLPMSILSLRSTRPRTSIRQRPSSNGLSRVYPILPFGPHI